MAAGQRLDIGDVDGRELRRELDDDAAAAGELHHQQIVGIDRAPRACRRGRDDVARGLGFAAAERLPIESAAIAGK